MVGTGPSNSSPFLFLINWWKSPPEQKSLHDMRLCCNTEPRALAMQTYGSFQLCRWWGDTHNDANLACEGAQSGLHLGSNAVQSLTCFAERTTKPHDVGMRQIPNGQTYASKMTKTRWFFLWMSISLMYCFISLFVRRPSVRVQ